MFSRFPNPLACPLMSYDICYHTLTRAVVIPFPPCPPTTNHHFSDVSMEPIAFEPSLPPVWKASEVGLPVLRRFDRPTPQRRLLNCSRRGAMGRVDGYGDNRAVQVHRRSAHTYATKDIRIPKTCIRNARGCGKLLRSAIRDQMERIVPRRVHTNCHGVEKSRAQPGISKSAMAKLANEVNC